MEQGSEFKITLPIEGYIERSYKDENGIQNNVLVVQGIASDTSKDQLAGKMSESCIIHMVDCVNNGAPVPLLNKVSKSEGDNESPVGIDVDHSGHWTDQIGRAVEAKAVYELTDEMKEAGYSPPLLYVKAEVDLDMSHGKDLKRALQKGTQLGMSVWGFVKDGHVEVNRATGEKTEHFNLVELKKIAITSRPVNKNTWLGEVRRSMSGVQMEEKLTPEALSDLGGAVAPITEPVTDAAPEPEVARAETEVEVTAPENEGSPEAETNPEVPDEVARGNDAGGAGTGKTYDPASDATAKPVPKSDDGTPITPAGQPPFGTPAMPSQVARSEEYEVLHTELSGVTEVLRGLPDVLTGMNGELSRALTEIGVIADALTKLAQEFDSFRAEPMGRRGVVARSEEYKPLGSELTAEKRREVMAELKRRNQGAAAVNLLFGNLTDPLGGQTTPEIPQELLNHDDIK